MPAAGLGPRRSSETTRRGRGHLRRPGQLHHLEGDLARPDEPGDAVRRAADWSAPSTCWWPTRPSSEGTLATVTADELDATWAVNTRATVLLVQRSPPRRPGAGRPGRVVLFTSGQHVAACRVRCSTAVSKGAIKQMTLTLSDALDRPPASPLEHAAPRTGGHRLGHAGDHRPGRSGAASGPVETRPDEVAEVVAWLCSAEAGLVTGQTLDTEAGFRRWST